MTVLARKYRPQTFQSVVGQESTLQALSNALALGRLHHAYLFTGTRGVGKTTLARILAKCFNCGEGVTPTPCEKCPACTQIQANTFVDLIEIDAASRTKVEDTRDLLEGVQYLPTQGRYKIYLIDEVHMLSNHSFNALLKTLEEPPSHVVFILATTDPQKLPSTILSRCLQFHLWKLSEARISQHLEQLCQQEKVEFEFEAIQALSKAAEGSMRDALSLLDQAIGYGNNRVTVEQVRTLLGLSGTQQLLDLANAISLNNRAQSIYFVRQIVQSGADLSLALDQLLELFHAIALYQAVGEIAGVECETEEVVKVLAERVLPETIQLYYQIGLQGQKDLVYAPNPPIGFEMTILRILAFQPVAIYHESPPQLVEKPQAEPIKSREPVVTQISGNSEFSWEKVVSHLKITGITRMLAEHCVLGSWDEKTLVLHLENGKKMLLSSKQAQRLEEAVSEYFSRPIVVKVLAKNNTGETPAEKNERVASKRQKEAEEKMSSHHTVQALMDEFGATISHVTVDK